MDYEQKYKEALERAKSFDLPEYKNIMASVFPELAESEDEKIRQLLIKFVKYDMPNNYSDDFSKEDCLAWLEKQGEQNLEWSKEENDKISNIVAWIKDYPRLAKFNEEAFVRANNYAEWLKSIRNKYIPQKHGEQKPFDYENANIQQKDFAPKSALESAKEVKVDNQNCVKPAKAEPKFKVGDTITDPTDSTFTFHINAIKDGKYMESDEDWVLIKEANSDYELVEQKLADKVEPKFYEGEWAVTDKNNVVQIKTIENGKYVLENTMRFSVDYVDKCWRKWTIQDAKDGDVLCCESGWTCIFKALDNHTNTFSSYCFMDSDKWFCNTGSGGHTLDKAFIKAYNGEIHPATKEQRDTLEKAMADAGYAFDFEKKELRKIEQKIVGFNIGDEITVNGQVCKVVAIDNLAWSEEDIIHLNNSISYMSRINESEMDWLKSLKDRVQPQNTWKPSDEQMDMLAKVCSTLHLTSGENEIMESIYDALKKLK